MDGTTNHWLFYWCHTGGKIELINWRDSPLGESLTNYPPKNKSRMFEAVDVFLL